eukprot:TRINITY_DN6896_c0_g1_i1.p1 TRINITY_DN6896_c0_g1~~TRINITY_DN6896_c0_g1_i1.p1  ORF type:complete len:286 (+),score=34.18 TRINITY_DN6896_c0_g1_i1:32-889(+)
MEPERQSILDVLPEDILILIANQLLSLSDVRSIILISKKSKHIFDSPKIWIPLVKSSIGPNWTSELEPYQDSNECKGQETLNTSAIKSLYRRWFDDQFMFADVRIIRSRESGTSADPRNLTIGALFRVSLFGSEACGKSQILNQVIKGYESKYFEAAYEPTIGVTFGTCYMSFRQFPGAPVSPRVAKFEIWDASGQPRFDVITSSYIRGSHIVMLCFDLCNKDSFSALRQRFLPMISNAMGGDTSRLNIFVVGCKLDLAETQRQVSSDEARQYAVSLGSNTEYME